jgi:hypothetical protein
MFSYYTDPMAPPECLMPSLEADRHDDTTNADTKNE